MYAEQFLRCAITYYEAEQSVTVVRTRYLSSRDVIAHDSLPDCRCVLSPDSSYSTLASLLWHHIPHDQQFKGCYSSILHSFSRTGYSDSQITVYSLLTNLNSREKFEPGPGFDPRTYRSLAQRSTGSIDCTGLNLSPESNAVQDVVVCDTTCHHLTSELTSHLFILIF